MKNRVLVFILVLSTMVIISGCAGGVQGVIYTDVKLPVNATSNDRGSKQGEAVCKSILSVYAWGDCSIEKAAEQGNIKKIKSVDNKVWSVLGLYTEQTTIVTGE